MCVPTFIVLGPGRSGTSWIYEALAAHPEVFTAKGTKETLFFDFNYERGEEWYLSFFKGCRGKKAVGEVSNNYIYHREIPERIKRLAPDCTLICCFRNPIDRLISAYYYRLRKGQVYKDLEDAISKDPKMISDNFYATQLSWYYGHFDRRQIKVFFYDDLCGDPAAFVRNLYTAIGVSADFVPNVLHTRINPAARVAHPLIGKLTGITAALLRKLRLHKLLDTLKRSKLVRSIVLRENKGEGNTAALPEYLRSDLLEKFRPEIEKLSEMTGRDLSNWMV